MFQSTKDDVVFAGHGATLLGQGHETRVPEDVEFYIFGPPGTALADHVQRMLEGGVSIRRLYMLSPKTGATSTIKPTVYTHKSGPIPDLILGDSHKIKLGQKGVVPHIIGVDHPTRLHDMWPLLTPFKRSGRTLRVMWAACSTMGDVSVAPKIHAE